MEVETRSIFARNPLVANVKSEVDVAMHISWIGMASSFYCEK